jgi:hypothetical protein
MNSQYHPDPAIHYRRGGRTACGHKITARMVATGEAGKVNCVNCLATRAYRTDQGTWPTRGIRASVHGNPAMGRSYGTKGLTMTDERETNFPTTAPTLFFFTVGSIIEFEYTNYAGVEKKRRVDVLQLAYGKTHYHPDVQMFIHGFDHEKQAERTFAIRDMRNVEIITIRK